MFHLWRMRNLAKMVQELLRQEEKTHPVEYNDAKLWYPSKDKVVSAYAEKYRKTPRQAREICRDALNDGYLRLGKRKEGSEKITTLEMGTEGRWLVSWSGFLEELLKRHGKTWVFVLGLITSGAAYALWQIIKAAF